VVLLLLGEARRRRRRRWRWRRGRSGDGGDRRGRCRSSFSSSVPSSERLLQQHELRHCVRVIPFALCGRAGEDAHGAAAGGRSGRRWRREGSGG